MWKKSYKNLSTITSKVSLNRKEQFVEGRRLLKELELELTHLDRETFLRGPSGEILHSDNIVASLTHTKDFLAAVMGFKKDFLSVGIDSEFLRHDRLHILRLEEKICTKDELALMDGLEDWQKVYLLFSAKESIYKALFPLVKKFFMFHQATLVAFIKENKQLVFLINKSVTENDEYETVLVDYIFEENYVHTLCILQSRL